jgi:hypothetical protein
MPMFRLLALLPLLLVDIPLHAQDLSTACRASSSYDVTLGQDSLMFERAAPAPFHVQMQRGSLRTDGAAVALNAEDQDRLDLFQRELRALVPRVRRVGDNGVDMAMQALHEEAGRMGLSVATRAELDRRLAAHASELKQRIAASQSTRDWQGSIADQAMNRIAADLLPLLASDLGQQAIDAALNGDMQAAAELRDRATALATELQPRLQQRMQALRPQVEALCPSIRRLAELQQGVRDSQGRPLNLLQIEP